MMTKDNTMIYLEIHNVKDGMKVFKCGTRYDWYLIKKIKNNNYLSCIKDEDGNIEYLNLLEWNFIPNSNFKKITNLIDFNKNNNLQILNDFNYSRLNKKIVNKNKDDNFKYELIYLTPKTGIRYMYSNVNNKGHFGIKKVIIGESGIENAINDYTGKYGMTQDSFGIIINNKEEGDEILKFIKNKEFIELIKKSLTWSNFRIDWRLFTYFKKDFYKV
jgi:hypothetical protein